MFGLSFGEILIVLVVALLVLGPSGMPKLARTLGKGLREFRKATTDLKDSMETEFYEMDQVAKAAVAPPETRPAPVAGAAAPVPGAVAASGVPGAVAANGVPGAVASSPVPATQPAATEPAPAAKPTETETETA